MGHPNEGFLRQFLGTDKEYQQQLRATEKKQRVEQYYLNRKNKPNILEESEKKTISRTIEKVYSNRKNNLLVEQKINQKEWKMVNTAYGIFYHNEKEHLWMNTFGVVKKSLGEFIQLNDYSSFDSDKTGAAPDAPSNPQIQVESGNVGTFTLSWQDNSVNETGFAIYVLEG